jgi:putative peptidoglycan lipid II flippase
MSAASVIMLMFVISRVLGLFRQRILAGFFNPEELSIFFAAFRLPDLVFEILVFGTFSSAFIPVFAKAIKKGDHEAWEIAGRVVNIGLFIFIALSLVFGLFANQIYTVVAPGFSNEETQKIANLPGFFCRPGFLSLAMFLDGVLICADSKFRHWLRFYNLGNILGTVFHFARSNGTAPGVIEQLHSNQLSPGSWLLLR